MRGSLRAISVVFIVIVAAGCAGRQFVRAEPDTLVLGRTTEVEIRQRFGNPYREGTKLTNGEQLRTTAYAYAVSGGSLVGDIVPTRVQAYYFWNGVLVGHEFTSSFDEDKTELDINKAHAIKVRETDEAAVVALLGKPQGVYVYPLIKDKNARGLIYLYGQTRGSAFNLKFYQQLVVVTLQAGVVTDVSVTASGER
jgi:hypothetical protein